MHVPVDGADLWVSPQKPAYAVVDCSYLVLGVLYDNSGGFLCVVEYDMADMLLIICRVNLSKIFIVSKACCSILMWLVVFLRHGHDFCLH